MFGAFGLMSLGSNRLCTASEWADDQDGCTINDSNYYYAISQKKSASAPTSMTAAQQIAIANAAPYEVIASPSYTASSLAAAIQAAGGSLSVWTADANKSAELQAAKANPGLFSVVAIQPAGTYKITLKAAATPEALVKATATSAEPLGGYLPYILGGVGLIVVLSMLKK